MTKILIDRATAEQTLKALKEFGYHSSSPRWERTANDLKAALEQQPVQEPTPWRDMVVVSLVREGLNKHKARELANHFAAQPEQQAEPVACRFCFSEKGCWTWQCHHCGEIDDVQQPAPLPVQPEQDFKTATKEDAALKQVIDLIQPVAALANGTPFEHSEVIQRCVDAVEIALEALAQPVQEPVAYDKTEMNSFVINLYDKKMQEGKHGHYETMFHVVHQAIKRVTLPLPVQPESVTWDKPSASFNAWWDGDRRRDSANPFTTDSFSYWAWEGWQAALAQRPWVGLTEEEIMVIGDKVANEELVGLVSNFRVRLARAIEQTLKEKNHG